MSKAVDFGSEGRAALKKIMQDTAKIADPDNIIESIEMNGSNRAFGGSSLIDNPHTEDITRIIPDASLIGYGKFYRSKDWAFRGSAESPGITVCMAPDSEATSDGVILETKLDGLYAQKFYFLTTIQTISEQQIRGPSLDNNSQLLQLQNPATMSFDAVITRHPQTSIAHIDLDLVRTLNWWEKFGNREMPKPLTGGVMKIYDLQEIDVKLPDGTNMGAVVCVADEREDRYLGNRFTPEEMGAIVATAAGLPTTNPNYKNGYPGSGKLTNLQYMFNDANNTYQSGKEMDSLRRRILDCAIHFRAALGQASPEVIKSLTDDEVTEYLHEKVTQTQSPMPTEYEADPVAYLKTVREKLGSAPAM